jgi:hypothetical protein
MVAGALHVPVPPHSSVEKSPMRMTGTRCAVYFSPIEGERAAALIGRTAYGSSSSVVW